MKWKNCVVNITAIDSNCHISTIPLFRYIIVQSFNNCTINVHRDGFVLLMAIIIIYEMYDRNLMFNVSMLIFIEN